MPVEKKPKIACLGWGSLIWDPKELPIGRAWHEDGPELPIEFSRESSGGRITLVICDQGTPVRSLWTEMKVTDLEAGILALAKREGVEGLMDKGIGCWDRKSNKTRNDKSGAIAAWASQQDIDGLVWTSLQCGFKDRRNRMPSAEAILDYLRCLDGDNRARAEEYIRKAPAQIHTAYRQLIAAEFGWSAIQQ